MRVLNVVAIVLLALAVVGVYAMPRVNYGEIASQIEDNRQTIAEIGRVCSAHQDATISVMGTLPEESTEFILELARLGESVSELRSRLEETQESLASAAGTNPESAPIGLFSAHYLDPIEVSEEILEQCSAIPSSSGLVQNGFDGLLRSLCEGGILPCEDASDIPTWAMDELSDIYGYFSMLIRLVERRQHLMVDNLVLDATVAGDYFDVLDGDQQALQRMQESHGKRPGIRRSVRMEGGKRHFYFAYEDYPGLNTEQAEQNAKHHLVRDVRQVAERIH